jgi:hypothetical protein
LALVDVLKTVLVTVPTAWPLGHGHHVWAPLLPAQAVAGQLPLAGLRVRKVPRSTSAWHWPASAGCGQAPAIVCMPRAWGRPLRHAQDRTEAMAAVAWSTWCFHRLLCQQPRQALGMCYCRTAGRGPGVNGDGMPLPRLSSLADVMGMLRVDRSNLARHVRSPGLIIYTRVHVLLLPVDPRLVSNCSARHVLLCDMTTAGAPRSPPFQFTWLKASPSDSSRQQVA